LTRLPREKAIAHLGAQAAEWEGQLTEVAADRQTWAGRRDEYAVLARSGRDHTAARCQLQCDELLAVLEELRGAVTNNVAMAGTRSEQLALGLETCRANALGRRSDSRLSVDTLGAAGADLAGWRAPAAEQLSAWLATHARSYYTREG